LSGGGGTKGAPRNPRFKRTLLRIKMNNPPAKRPRYNPLGEDCYLLHDLTVIRDEDKIIRAQQIFKNEYYKPDGKWFTDRIKNRGDSLN
jgi:hypothetical protein